MTKETKLLHRLLKKLYNQKPAEPIKSIMEKPRCHYESYDSWCEYGLYEDEPNLNDDELNKLIWDSIAIKYHWREYDCTGQPFTWHIHWKRLGNGLISVINYINLDV